MSNNDLTLFRLYSQKVVLALNAVGGVGVVEGSEKTFSDNIGNNQRNSSDVFGGVRVNSSEHIEGVSSNLCDIIAYWGRRK
jgi:hypothetical protein